MKQITDPIEIGKAMNADPHEHCTADPLFCVQECVRIHGMDSDYAEEWSYIDEEGNEADAEEKPALDRMAANGELPLEWTKSYYIDQWRTVQTFFTQQSADAFIERRSHDYRWGLRVDIDSAYRNEEMKAVMALLKRMAKEATDATNP